ncbi:hypothetical protein C3747_7g489 [Trypanosoma cruzi]|uniref:Target of rapamycin (TOR) kinase 1 n=1 Tax=Trypanosoma cruzi TaxID=5693 RepID=A0A2V2XGY9_TRYCR|nr:hypothetical protein C3747_7g489 [Trypanosoma cruzi]
MPLFGCGGETTGLLRRWIAWPRDKNRDDPYEAHAPLLHISRCLPPVLAEAASCLDVKASLLKFLLPRETRHLFRCRVEDGTLEELARPPVGYKASPEILQITINSAIAAVTTVAHPLWLHLHWCVSTLGPTIYALQGRKAVRHCGKPSAS